jgi:hypothetical protein
MAAEQRVAAAKERLQKMEAQASTLRLAVEVRATV